MQSTIVKMGGESMSGKWRKKKSGPQGYSKYHLNSYNYNFLKTKIKKACRDEDIKVLCVGVSYSMFGLIDKKNTG